jgi:hypothetical protein
MYKIPDILPDPAPIALRTPAFDGKREDQNRPAAPHIGII